MTQRQPSVPFPLLPSELERLVDTSFMEDLSAGDVTTDYLIQPGWRASGSFVVKGEGVLAGLPVAKAVFQRLDPSIEMKVFLEDGSAITPGMIIGEVAGPATTILKAERVALNYMQRLSGVATETAKMVAAVRDLPVRITETRKTTPGLRALEKYAVRVGGGYNHRQNLSDGVLIKDNHLEALAKSGVSLVEAVHQARRTVPHLLQVEVEVANMDQVEEALSSGAEWILLDNMSVEEMAEAVKLINGRAQVEASGGITADKVRAVAETGVNLISSGALTHSYKALDISLELEYHVSS